MCEVINTQSGHQIRASVKIFLVLRDPDCFCFFSFVFLIKTLYHYVKYVYAFLEVFSSVLTSMTSVYCTNRRSP